MGVCRFIAVHLLALVSRKASVAIRNPTSQRRFILEAETLDNKSVFKLAVPSPI